MGCKRHEPGSEVNLGDKGVVIGEKRPWDEKLDITPAKKGKLASDAKKTGTTSPPGDKKKATLSKTAISTITIREGTLVNPGTALGPRVSMLRSLATIKKHLDGVIPPLDKEKVEKLDLDWVVSKFVHIVSQVII